MKFPLLNVNLQSKNTECDVQLIKMWFLHVQPRKKLTFSQKPTHSTPPYPTGIEDVESVGIGKN